jgi:hypothetical protein
MINGVLDSYKNDPRRELKLWDWMCQSRKTWRACNLLMRRTYERERELLVGAVGGRFKWAAELVGREDTPTVPGLRMGVAEARLKEDFFLWTEINTFVDGRLDRGEDVDVLAHLRDFWGRVEDAIDEVSFHSNAVIMRIYMLVKAFVDSGFVGRLRDLHRTSLFSGPATTSAPKRIAGRAGPDTTIDGSGQGKPSELAIYRPHSADLNGQPYRNTSGNPYMGSICDWCEAKGHNYYHHPLRCGRCYPKYKTEPPEENGVTSWYTRD